MKNMLLINFKTYKEGSSNNGLKLAKICDEIAKKKKKDILIAVQSSDIYKISKSVRINVLAQHIDPIEPGRNTGFIEASDVKKDGAYGTILNHSEHKLKFNDLKRSFYYSKKAGLKVIICAATPSEVKKVAILKPDYIAIEPPALIGGNISVSKANPNIIKNSVKLTKIPVLCGAGIKDSEDVRIAISLGAKGILVASGIVLSKNKKKSVEELIKNL